MTITAPRADDLRSLNPLQLDALREVANMGAAHAATALSQMTGGTIMIAVPRLHVAPLAEVAPELAPGEQPVAAVMMDMLGDLTGRTLLVFPKPTVLRLAELMLRRPMGSSVALGELEQSAVQEIGNILSGAYLNALSDFMGMVLLPSPPTLAVGRVDGVVAPEFLRLEVTDGAVFVVETEFLMQEAQERLRGFFLLLPDPASLQAILRAVRLA
jgi:chemotaxis protein CheC